MDSYTSRRQAKVYSSLQGKGPQEKYLEVEPQVPTYEQIKQL